MSKLVFVNRFFYPDISATSQMLSDAAFYLADRDHEVHVVTSRLHYEGGATLPDFEVLMGVTVHRVWTTRFGRSSVMGRSADYLTFYLMTFVKLLTLLAESDSVVAKTDPPMVSVPVYWAAKLKRARLINWLQDLFPEVASQLGMNIPSVVVNLLTLARNLSLTGARHNIVIGHQMRDRLIGLGVKASQISVVTNWSDGERVTPGGSEALRSSWGLEGNFVVGYSGNLGRAHQIDAIVGAIRLLQDEPGVRFLFVGGGALMQRLKTIVQRERLAHVRFEPYQSASNLSASLGVPDIHLVSLHPDVEGLIVPSKIYGILAAGKPVINLVC